MTPLSPAELTSFSRQFRFAGGRLRKLKIRYAAQQPPTIEFVLTVRPTARSLGDTPKPVHLRFRLSGVEEFRFQKRPSVTAGTISEARFGAFDGLYFVNLDAFGLSPGEVPKPHDFRASDAYAAAQELAWEQVPS